MFKKIACLAMLEALAIHPGHGQTADPNTGAPVQTSPDQSDGPPLGGRPPRGDGPHGKGHFTTAKPAYQDVAYASLSPAQKLDVYLPATGSGPFPLVVMVHGGGFEMGDKASGGGLSGVDTLLGAGYAVASINYRLSQEAKYPAQIFDCKAAVRFLRAHAAEYKLDPDKFAAFGASAGGNLVALLGTTGGVKELEGADLGNAEQSSRVQAVVDWFGPIDFLAMDAQFAAAGGRPTHHGDANSPESRLVGAAIQSVPDLVKTTNASNYVTADDPPFFIEHGTVDRNVPPVQGKNLADALRPAIGADKVTYVSLEGAGHGGPQFNAPENFQQVVAFLNKHLR